MLLEHFLLTATRLAVLLDLLSKLDVSILFVQVFVEFVDFAFNNNNNNNNNERS